MILQPILALIIIRFLRKSLDEQTTLPKWSFLLTILNGVSIALIVLYPTVKSISTIVEWLSQVLIFLLVFFALYEKDFRAARQSVYAFIPVIAIYFIEDVVKLIDPGFHKKWETYFNTGGFFAFIWMAAVLIMSGRQRKALEKEKQKTEEKEKQNRITENLKAALEVQVKERTAELTLQKEELQHALEELKSTQSQLIQSEKMASLGELTAGIAHEIQNPLNFVNNFSEVSNELIDELSAERLKAESERDTTLENELLTDIKQNLEKINYHGKRADAIVKGMLQHSRASNGQKEPTDINALCDEYLRLSYHGLRAKDKSFNAGFETDFDNSIGVISVIPQDLGRVIMNLLTNAFYAVNEKAKLVKEHYKPVVTISTKKTNTAIDIKVADNGNGIPQNIIDKIFQPFFTTKPTGQGTGLGLSLSYDIVKAHGGELKAETKEGEGVTFLIRLPLAE